MKLPPQQKPQAWIKRYILHRIDSVSSRWSADQVTAPVYHHPAFSENISFCLLLSHTCCTWTYHLLVFIYRHDSPVARGNLLDRQLISQSGNCSLIMKKWFYFNDSHLWSSLLTSFTFLALGIFWILWILRLFIGIFYTFYSYFIFALFIFTFFPTFYCNFCTTISLEINRLDSYLIVGQNSGRNWWSS